jgi:hypothetical protein
VIKNLPTAVSVLIPFPTLNAALPARGKKAGVLWRIIRVVVGWNGWI